MTAGADPRNGLTAQGREQVSANTKQWLVAQHATIERYALEHRLALVNSPFSRARETAEIVADVIDAAFPSATAGMSATLRSQIELVPDLRERNFGSFEGQDHSDRIYQRVWEQDARDPTHTLRGVESVQAVQDRASRVIVELEASARARGRLLYLLVSHGDTLKILQSGLQRQSPAAHVDPALVPPYRTGEIRALTLMDY